MTTRAATALSIPLVVAGIAVAVLASTPQPAESPARPLLVFTEVPGPAAAADRFPDASRIVALDLSAPGAEPVVLTEGFAAARAPAVHFDGSRMVFAGRRAAEGPWQIWEMDLEAREPRLLVPSCVRCTDPIYRADDGVVFVAPAAQGSARLAVYTVAPGDDEATRITHHPYSDAALGLVADGRVVVATGAAPSGPTAYYALRHDGTGAELMYRHPEGSVLIGRAHETGRRLVFVERPRGAERPRVVSISQAYPATSRREILSPPEGRIHSVVPTPDGSLIASYRGPGKPTYGLWRMGPDGGREPVLADDGYSAIEPVLAAPRERPLGFVTATDPAAETGRFFGFDARLGGLGSIDSAATVLRVRTQDGRLGDVPLAADGSFHIELPPDTPVRLETLDSLGNVIAGPSAWIWVRPGELRGCVGCHESRARAPDNRLPLAADRPAVPLGEGTGTGNGEGR